jgi:hypothetical protein
MARLTIEQVKAPDFSAASDILAASGRSFNAGMDSASSLLEKYQAGQTSKDDASIAAELAKISSEEEFNAYIEKNPFAGRNASDEMISTVLGTRKDTLGYAQDRAVTDGQIATTDNTRATAANTRSGMAINEAAEGRTAWTFDDNRNGMLERRGAAGAIYQAAQDGNALGYGTGGPTSPEKSAVQSQAYQGMIDRGLPPHVAEGFMMNFQDESGFDIGITEGQDNVHGTRGKGIYQLTGERRDQFEKKYGDNYSMDNQLDFMMDELYGSESKAAASIFNTKTAGEAGNAIVRNFLRPAKEHQDSRGAAYLGNGGVRPDRIVVNPNANAGASMNAAQDLIGSMQYQDIDQMMAMDGIMTGAQQTGQTAIDAANQKAANDRNAEMQMAIMADETIVDKQGAINAALTRTNGVDAAEDLASITATATNFGEGGALNSLVSTGNGMDPTARTNAEAMISNVSDAQGIDLSVRAYEGAQSFKSNPIESLQAALQGTGAGDLSTADLSAAVRELSEDLKIPPEEAAYAYAQAVSDNSGLNADGWFTPGGDGLAQKKARAFAEDMFAEGNKSETRNRLVQDDVRITEANRLMADVDKATKQYEKSQRVNGGEASPTAEGNLSRAQAALDDALSRL